MTQNYSSTNAAFQWLMITEALHFVLLYSTDVNQFTLSATFTSSARGKKKKIKIPVVSFSQTRSYPLLATLLFAYLQEKSCFLCFQDRMTQAARAGFPSPSFSYPELSSSPFLGSLSSQWRGTGTFRDSFMYSRHILGWSKPPSRVISLHRLER